MTINQPFFNLNFAQLWTFLSLTPSFYELSEQIPPPAHSSLEGRGSSNLWCSHQHGESSLLIASARETTFQKLSRNLASTCIQLLSSLASFLRSSWMCAPRRP